MFLCLGSSWRFSDKNFNHCSKSVNCLIRNLGDDPNKDYIDGLSIFITVLVVTLVGSITYWNKENKFHELNNIQNERTKYKVIRNCYLFDISNDDLFIGDLINIMVNDILPAYLLLVDSNEIKMDESSLTWESDTLKKETNV